MCTHTHPTETTLAFRMSLRINPSIRTAILEKSEWLKGDRTTIDDSGLVLYVVHSSKTPFTLQQRHMHVLDALAVCQGAGMVLQRVRVGLFASFSIRNTAESTRLQPLFTPVQSTQAFTLLANQFGMRTSTLATFLGMSSIESTEAPHASTDTFGGNRKRTRRSRSKTQKRRRSVSKRKSHSRSAKRRRYR